MNLKIYRPAITDDVVPTLDTSNADIIEIDPDIPSVSTYISVGGFSGGKDGRLIILSNAARQKQKSIQVFFENANAAAADRLMELGAVTNPASPALTALSITSGRSVFFLYSATHGRWQVLDTAAGGVSASVSSGTYGAGGV